jgi:hypothetical protein
MTDIRVPYTDPLLPPGMTDKDTEPVPGDEQDGHCDNCGAPLDESGNCPDRQCTEYQELKSMQWRGWGCSEACGFCGRC